MTYFSLYKKHYYYYLDNNTISYSDHHLDTVVESLETDSLNLINWFSINLMKDNPDKFQAIAIGKKPKWKQNVKLLGITIGSDLNFNNHISDICKKASKQLNNLKRMGKYLKRLDRLTAYYSFILWILTIVQ